MAPLARGCLIASTIWHFDAVSGSHPPHLLCAKRIFRHKVIDGTVRPGGWAERSLPSISYGKALADELRMLSLIDGRDRKICDIDRALTMRVAHKFSGRHAVFARAMRLWRCSQGPSLNM